MESWHARGIAAFLHSEFQKTVFYINIDMCMSMNPWLWVKVSPFFIISCFVHSIAVIQEMHSNQDESNGHVMGNWTKHWLGGSPTFQFLGRLCSMTQPAISQAPEWSFSIPIWFHGIKVDTKPCGNGDTQYCLLHTIGSLEHFGCK